MEQFSNFQALPKYDSLDVAVGLLFADYLNNVDREELDKLVKDIDALETEGPTYQEYLDQLKTLQFPTNEDHFQV